MVTIRGGKSRPRFPILYIEAEKLFCTRKFEIKANANFLSSIFHFSKISYQNWIKKYFDGDGLSSLAPDKTLEGWIIDLEELMADLGLEPSDVTVCFPPPKPMLAHQRVPMTVHIVDTLATLAPSSPAW
ncbi:hypothetical protein SUGI_0066640 [Cryptomeria japonica]|nr:hypothetical protein SUGI_0066640 [Cryptomeria japonica]